MTQTRYDLLRHLRGAAVRTVMASPAADAALAAGPTPSPRWLIVFDFDWCAAAAAPARDLPVGRRQEPDLPSGIAPVA